MNREQKAAAIEEIAAQITEAGAVFAVDYRGISVPQAAELRGRLRDADASFRIVKNTLTERAVDRSDRPGAEALKALLEGPTALTFVHGDAATAAKALADYARTTNLLAFKGGLMNGDALAAQQLSELAKLPPLDVLYGMLVNVVASPLTGLATSLNGLISGLARQLGQIAEQKESGEIPAGDAPAAEEPEAAAAPEPEPEPEAEAAPEPEPEPEAAPEPEPAPDPEPAAQAADEAPSDTDQDKE